MLSFNLWPWQIHFYFLFCILLVSCILVWSNNKTQVFSIWYFLLKVGRTEKANLVLHSYRFFLLRLILIPQMYSYVEVGKKTICSLVFDWKILKLGFQKEKKKKEIKKKVVKTILSPKSVWFINPQILHVSHGKKNLKP